MAVDDLGAALFESGLRLDAHRDAVLAVSEQHVGNLDDAPPGLDEPYPQFPVLVAVTHGLVVAADGEVGVASQQDAPDDRV